MAAEKRRRENFSSWVCGRSVIIGWMRYEGANEIESAGGRCRRGVGAE